ncbi:MAG: malate dehydrogenase [Candidatus Omnitrophica bacterium]|nr:malate dehydrogenase [Candidatus Omnitrophota bacterium]MBU4303898.1 malate dehydrogenase [Candidatus Omnitrophota bacterium]MBU4418816.1 malate dehydrogenase [Candidatus Omnitrophota bacterium]MBU4468075.1 malate dehydrogenase [Candidatus Omnitrophota bacterium]MCG2707850.1 malate dehydrogenase [Candidatus Omnitrophota bacterium]
MKISIIGAGNVGSLAAMRIAADGSGDVLLIDIVKGLALGKALDLEDARPLLKSNYSIKGSDDITQIKDSNIIVVTAGLARKPGMTREELITKNAQILKDVCLKIKELAPDAVVIIVTNPLDIMTLFALKITGFKPGKLFGMGISLDTARFINLISQELHLPATDIEALVIGAHGEGMLPLPRFAKVKGVSLDEFISDDKIESLINRTINRGAQIVANLGTGSAFFAPSAAIASIVKTIVKDEKRTIGLCSYLNGQYGIKDTCIGVPCRVGKNGIEQVMELDLSQDELTQLTKSAMAVAQTAAQLFA